MSYYTLSCPKKLHHDHPNTPYIPPVREAALPARLAYSIKTAGVDEFHFQLLNVDNRDATILKPCLSRGMSDARRPTHRF